MQRRGKRLRIETLAQGLEVPWDLGFAPDGRIFLTERPGRIRVIEGGRLREQPWASLEVFAAQEAGLMGLAIDPDFAQNRYVYVVGTFLTAPRAGFAWLVDRAVRRVIALFAPGAASIFANRVVRLEDRGGSGAQARVLIDDLPAAQLHAGAALDFGPDGALFVTTGEAERGSAAQDPGALEGKLLRYEKDGRVPDVPGAPRLRARLPQSAGARLGSRARRALRGRPRAERAARRGRARRRRRAERDHSGREPRLAARRRLGPRRRLWRGRSRAGRRRSRRPESPSTAATRCRGTETS